MNKAQAYSLVNSGVGHIFFSAYSDKDRVSLIIHELGHAFGLHHTFTDEIKGEISDNKELIERLENEKKELEKINRNLQLKNYYSLDKKYFFIQSILTDSETKKISIKNFENSFILNLTGGCSYYSNDKLVTKTATSVIAIENSQLITSEISISDEIQNKI